ncbi:MAG TPA: SOS response-associated peptidase [Candidatus Chromulinivoraceae bacterium]|nr:SOS response-associated peptidase [Candidatus Chromulinivoraceae bacterium]
MISRYSLYTTADLRDRFTLADGLPKGIKPRYNIHPTLQAPVILNKNGHAVVEQMSWGLTPKGTKNTNSVFRYKTYNVPSEKVLTKHSWETAVRHNRCLIPANGFYQLVEQGNKKQAYYIQLKDTPIFAFAGIYSSWDDGNETHSTYSIITSDTPYALRNISDRMPIVLSRSEETRWLDTSITDANALFDMLRPISSEQLLVSEVSADIHSLKIDMPQLIKPL